jgi:hypothetical protein
MQWGANPQFEMGKEKEPMFKDLLIWLLAVLLAAAPLIACDRLCGACFVLASLAAGAIFAAVLHWTRRDDGNEDSQRRRPGPRPVFVMRVRPAGIKRRAA